MISFSHLFSFSRKEIDAAFKQAQRQASINGLKLLFSDKAMDDHGKLLIIVPKSFGNAPKRNRIKRQIKSIYFEEKLYEKKIASILLVYKEARDLSFEQLKKFLVKAYS